jgi:hypothetical protein
LAANLLSTAAGSDSPSALPSSTFPQNGNAERIHDFIMPERLRLLYYKTPDFHRLLNYRIEHRKILDVNAVGWALAIPNRVVSFKPKRIVETFQNGLFRIFRKPQGGRGVFKVIRGTFYSLRPSFSREKTSSRV